MGLRKEKTMENKKETLEFGWKYNEPWRKLIINKSPDSDRYIIQVYEHEWDGDGHLTRRDLVINAVVESLDILYKD
tara:strand:- start:139 stop:366 length:228 start_codon:yes stop_codon:yes gene_type:complete